MRCLAFALLLAATPALAQESPQTTTNAEGDYGGVNPGEPKKVEPGKKAKKPPPKGTLSWIGFEAKDSGSQIFLQSVAPFEVAQRVDGSTLVLTLTGVSRLGAKVWPPIDTRFFDTPVSRVFPNRKGSRSVEVRVAFKNPKDAAQGTVRTATEADGLYYVYVGFSGSGTSAEPAPAPAPADAP